jgi:hypothetical protein
MRLDKYIRSVYGDGIPQSIIEMALRQRDITVNGGKARAGMMINDPKTVCFSHLE